MARNREYNTHMCPEWAEPLDEDELWERAGKPGSINLCELGCSCDGCPHNPEYDPIDLSTTLHCEEVDGTMATWIGLAVGFAYILLVLSTIAFI